MLRGAVVLLAAALCAGIAYTTAGRWLPGLVDAVRGLPGVGFGRMHRLEQAVFEARDGVLRAWEDAPEVRGVRVRPPPEALARLWPPAPLQPPLIDAAPMDGEGRWRPVAKPCAPGVHVEGAVETFVRVDPERPSVVARVVALDMRRLALRVQAGQLDAGPTGGRVPEQDARALVAAFNGGFKTPHGRFGLRSEARTWVPPRDGKATLAIDALGRVGLGVWDKARDDARLDATAGMRQNLRLLVDGATVRGALTVEADGQPQPIGHSVTRRSGVCVRPPWTFYYVWTKRGRADALGRAMRVAGCTRGMHLDLNAYHTSFQWLDLPEEATQAPDGGWPDVCAERLDPKMTDSPPGRYIAAPQDRDFMYIVRRPVPVEAPVWDRLGPVLGESVP